MLGHIGRYPVERPPDRCQYLDPAFHPEVDDNIPGKHAKLKGVVGATPKAIKSDKVSRGRGRLGAVKTRRVVDPG